MLVPLHAPRAFAAPERCAVRMHGDHGRPAASAGPKHLLLRAMLMSTLALGPLEMHAAVPLALHDAAIFKSTALIATISEEERIAAVQARVAQSRIDREASEQVKAATLAQKKAATLAAAEKKKAPAKAVSKPAAKAAPKAAA